MDFLVYTLQLLQCTKCSVCAMQPTYGYTARIGVFEHLKRPDLPARPWRAVDAFVGGEQSLLHLQPANLAMAGRTGRSNQHRMVRAMPPAQCRGSLHRCSSTRTAPPPAASQLLRATAVTANQPTFFFTLNLFWAAKQSPHPSTGNKCRGQGRGSISRWPAAADRRCLPVGGHWVRLL